MSEWIKCEERLPEMDTSVDVLVSLLPGMNPIVVQAFHMSGGEFLVANTECDLAGVTHWQPLPKAPNE